MLLQFNFSNHKSFREEASLDLTATGINEYGDHVFNIGNEKIKNFKRLIKNESQKNLDTQVSEHTQIKTIVPDFIRNIFVAEQ